MRNDPPHTRRNALHRSQRRTTPTAQTDASVSFANAASTATDREHGSASSSSSPASPQPSMRHLFPSTDHFTSGPGRSSPHAQHSDGAAGGMEEPAGGSPRTPTVHFSVFHGDLHEEPTASSLAGSQHRDHSAATPAGDADGAGGGARKTGQAPAAAGVVDVDEEGREGVWSERGGDTQSDAEREEDACESGIGTREYSRTFLESAQVQDLPPHLIPLAHAIYHLDETDLVIIADLAESEATKDVYSLLPYTGNNWFLPSIRECEDDEPHWGCRYSWHDGLLFFIGGRRLSIMILNLLLRIGFIVLCWFMLWNILPHYLVEPGGYVWDPAVLVVVSAIVGGLICRILQIPPLVGVLWIGIMWNNIPRLHYLTSGIVKKVFDISSKLGLTVILARAGYSLSIKGIIPHWKQSIMLATLPFALEGVAHSLIANKIFNYRNDYNWAFLQGMLCSIASPAVVVPGSLYLMELGYGKGVGPLSLMLSAVGVEIVIGVWCANFIIGLIFYDQKLAVAIVLGPVQFIGGTLIGIALGFGYYYIVELMKKEAHRLPNGKYQRQHFNSTMDFAFVIFLFACFTMVFLGYGVSLAGGGCVMCVFFAATVAHLWLRGGRKELEEQKKYVGVWLACAWDELMMPLLFATMGAKIDVLAIFNKDFFPKAIICLVCSTAVRITVIFLVQLGDGMPYKEKLIVCVGYLGKASAQASVGPIAANLVAEMIAKLPADQAGSLDTMAKYANYVQQMSAMYVMFMAAIASLGLVRGGMAVLKREAPATKTGRRQSSSPEENARKQAAAKEAWKAVAKRNREVLDSRNIAPPAENFVEAAADSNVQEDQVGGVQPKALSAVAPPSS